jgi:RNA polymerase sigma-70 factor (ECF subfamily)
VSSAADECKPEPDADLLCRIVERDSAAFDLLYRRYVRAVYGLALRQLHDLESAEDATRRTFAAIRSSAASYVPERGDSVRWVFTIARQAIGQRGAPDDGWEEFRIYAAVATLPEEERAPLELAYWSGWRPVEIAELLNLPLSTVVIRTRSALARLAEMLRVAA